MKILAKVDGGFILPCSTVRVQDRKVKDIEEGHIRGLSVSVSSIVAEPISSCMRADITEALRGRGITFLGANREKRRLVNYLHDGEIVHDLAPCSFGETGGRALLVATDERVLVIKDGWIFKNSQGMGYGDIRSVEITTGLLFSKIEFHGEGMDFEVTKSGRFSSEHIVKLIRGRIGSRYAAWERQRELALGNNVAQQTPVAEPVVPEVPTITFPPVADMPAQPHNTFPRTSGFPKPAQEFTSEPVTLDAFLRPPVAPQEPAPVTGPVATGRSLIEELERLSELHKSGAISNGEYHQAKQRLLNT